MRVWSVIGWLFQKRGRRAWCCRKGAYGSKDRRTIGSPEHLTGRHKYLWSATPDRSNPWADVSYEVGVNPVDDAGIDISHLKQGGHLRVPGAAIDPEIPTEISEP